MLLVLLFQTRKHQRMSMRSSSRYREPATSSRRGGPSPRCRRTAGSHASASPQQAAVSSPTTSTAAPWRVVCAPFHRLYVGRFQFDVNKIFIWNSLNFIYSVLLSFHLPALTNYILNFFTEIFYLTSVVKNIILVKKESLHSRHVVEAALFSRHEVKLCFIL